jgi:hypothetical protein
MKLPEYSPEQYRTLADTLSRIEKNEKKTVLFARAGCPDVADAAWYEALAPDAVVLDEDVRVDVKDLSEWTEERRLKLKVLTYAGKKANSEIKIDYNPVWEDVAVKDARVTSKAGDVKAISGDEVNSMDAKWVGDAARYPAGKTLVASLPAVEEGSLIEYTVVRHRKNRPFFYAGELFRGDYPVLRKKLRINAPDSIKLGVFVSEGEAGAGPGSGFGRGKIIDRNSAHEGRTNTLTFSAFRVEPVKREDSLPPWYVLKPMVVVSAGTWPGYAKAVNEALSAAASNCPVARRKAAELVAGLKSERERISAIRDFVAKNIRPAGPLIKELPLSRVTPADATLNDGYGNSADRAVLLYALLSSVGYHPEFVLSSGVSPIPSLWRPLLESPSPDWFGDCLVRVGAEREWYLNDTDEYAMAGTTAADGRPALFCVSGKIGPIRAQPELLQDREFQAVSVSLNEDGSARVKTTRKYFGMDFAAFHRKFAEMPPEIRRRHHLDLVATVGQGAVADGDYVAKFDVYPGMEEFGAYMEGFGVRQGDFLYLNIPGLISHLEGVEEDRRENPLYRDRASRKQIEVTVTLPDGVEAIEVAPGSFSVPVGNGGTFCMKTQVPDLKAPGKVLSIIQTSDIGPFMATAEEYPALLELDRRLGHPDAHTLVLRMKNKGGK